MQKLSLKIFTILLMPIFLAEPLFGQSDYAGMDVILEACMGCVGNNPTYIGDDTMNTLDIISDFGPRLINNTCSYNFHGGIDYTVPNGVEDRGYHVRAVVGGEIYRVRDSPTKYILIEGANHNFSYVHLFSNGNAPLTVGDMDFDHLDSYGPVGTSSEYRPCIVHRTNSDTIVYAACPNGNCNDSYKLYNQDTVAWNYFTNQQNQPDSTPVIAFDTIMVTNIVAQNTVIGSLGDSGVPGASHLHLQKHNVLAGIAATATYNKSSYSDPLEFVGHQGPEFIATIHNQGTNSNIDTYPLGIETKYPGTSASSFLVRATMPDTTPTGAINHGVGNNNNFYNNTMNVHEVKTSIKHSVLGNFDVILGPTYESRISFGAQINDLTKYPVTPRSVIETGQFKGNWNRTGIDSRAYNTECGTNYNRRWDDFYYADFVTRIHKNHPMNGSVMNANCPSDARYPDGRYDIFTQLTDVRDSTFNSDTLSFVLDNWKPYINEVFVHIGPHLIYDEDWNCNNTCVEFTNRNLSTNLSLTDLGQDMVVNVTTSEPLTGLSITIPTLNVQNLEMIPLDDSLHWEVTIEEYILENISTDVSLQFSGSDVSNNNIISFASSNINDCFSIPSRNSDTTFVDSNSPNLVYGIDSIHGFFIGCVDSDSIKGGFQSDSRNSNYKTFVGIIAPEITATSEVIHSYCHPECNNGSILIDIENQEEYDIVWSNGDYSFEIENLAAGDYAYTITDASCGFLEGSIEVECRPIQIQFETTASCDNDGKITTTVIDGKPPYTYAWVDDPNETSPDRSGLGSNVYRVIVTDANSCTASAATFVKDTDPIVLEDMEYSIQASSCAVDNGSINIFTPPSGGSQPFSYLWSNGSSGVDQSNNGNTAFNLAGGLNYVTITDIEGCIIVQEFDVPILGLPEVLNEVIDHTCENQSTGSIGVIATTENGGSPSYLWSTGSSDIVLSNVAAGIYHLTLTDPNNGCSVERSYEVLNLDSDPLAISAETIANCTGVSPDNGSISLNVTGGISPYSYQWSNGGTTQNIDNLAKGDYNVTVTDNCGQTATFSTYVDVTTINANGTWLLEFGEITIYTNPFGGELPYTYEWSNGSSTQNIMVEEEGTYTVTVTDVNGCEAQQNYIISLNCDPLAIEMETLPQSIDCNDATLIKFKETQGNSFVEGTPPFNIKISILNNQEWFQVENAVVNTLYDLSVYQFTSPTSGTYEVTVIDNCGDTFQEIYSGCLDCSYEFYNGGGNNDEVYVDIFNGMITLEQVCPCSDDCDLGFTHDKVKLYVDKPAIENSDLPWNLFNFTIDWPGDSQPNTVITKSWIGNTKKVKVQGPSEYVLSTDEFESGGVTVTVSYNLTENGQLEEQCATDVKFDYGKLGYNGEFVNWQSEDNPFSPEYHGPYYRGTAVCSTKCTTPFETGVLYANQPATIWEVLLDCEEDALSSAELLYYRFHPIDWDNPCFGGGYLETHIEFEGSIYKTNKYIGRDIALDQEESTVELPLDPNGTYCSTSSLYRGYCLFEGIDVYGVEISRHLIATYCKDDIFVPDPDADGDGIPDDEDPCPYVFGVFCDDDDDGVGTNPNWDTDEGCVPLFEPEECLVNIVCNDGSITTIDGVYSNEFFSGTEPCVHCFEATVCRVPDPNGGDDFVSIVGDIDDKLSVIQVVDINGCGCGYLFSCDLEPFYTLCLGDECPDVEDMQTALFEAKCSRPDHDVIIALQEEDDPWEYITSQKIGKKEALEIIRRSDKLKSENDFVLSSQPNPSGDQFEVIILSEKNISGTLRITNIVGENVLIQPIDLFKGRNSFNIDLPLSSGLYYITVRTNTQNTKSIKHVIYE